jgi:hypothetical protein
MKTINSKKTNTEMRIKVSAFFFSETKRILKFQVVYMFLAKRNIDSFIYIIFILNKKIYFAMFYVTVSISHFIVNGLMFKGY